MSLLFALKLAFALAVLHDASAQPGARNYKILDTYIGTSFLSRWNHEAIKDPTNGRVKPLPLMCLKRLAVPPSYVDKNTALAQNLTFASSDTLILRADSTTKLNPSGPGRNSVRLISQKQYGTSVTILNLRHMPQGCSTWPAFWTTSNSAPWPTAGEIDILEGVNDVGPNASTLHTTDGCIMNADNMVGTGQPGPGMNCYYQVNYNQGCQVQNNKPNNYGPALNAIGGGWYAMERTSNFINVWYWPRNDPAVPDDVRNGANQVNPAHWGKPYANFVNNNCDINGHFGPNNLIINLTFCGDWAGAPGVYPGPNNCPSTCVDFVNNNPGAFQNAYWNIASIRVYEPGCAALPVRRDLDAHRHHHHQFGHHQDPREL